MWLVAVGVSGLAQATAPTPAMQQGVAWLTSQVQADGSLRNESTAIATPYQARATAVLALSRFGVVPSALVNSVVAGTDGNTEYVARRILAATASGRASAADITTLLALQNDDGGWGLAATYASDALDTAMALQALHVAPPPSADTVAHALSFLAQAKHADGSWGVGDQSSVYITAHVLRACAGVAASYSTARSMATAAATWLLAARGQALDFGTTFNDASGLLALSTQSALNDARAPLIAALDAAQRADGSWADDPYLTALAVHALRSASLPSPDQISVRGHVIDGNTGIVLSGVAASFGGADTYHQATDANGDFVFPNVAAGAYTLQLTYDGYGTVTASTVVSAGQALDFGTIALLPVPPAGGPVTGTVQGNVTDATTLAPIAGATVIANGVSVTTAADGSYDIPNLAAGAVTVSAAAPGYQTVVGSGTLAAGGVVLFSPQLRAGSAVGDAAAVLLGVVTDASSGKPIEGASVAVTGADSATAQTDASGAYHIDGLAPGTVQLVVSAGGYDSVGASTQLDLNTAVTFSPTLYPSGTSPSGANTGGVSGTVIDSSSGQPLADVTMVATAPDDTTQTVTTDASGHFVVTGLTQEREALDFSLTGYVSAQFSAWVVPLKTIDIGQVRLRPVGMLKLLPDLIVDGVDSKTQAVSDPQSFQLSGEVQADIGNHGSGTAAAGVQVLAFYDANQDGVYDPDSDILLGKAASSAAIAPQGTQSLAIPVSGALPFRDAPVSVWVDSAQSVIELDETNNVGSSTSQCHLAPPPSTFAPALKWAWDGDANVSANVFGPVVVGHLTDDNGDGRYDQNDVPSLVFTAGSVLVAVSGKDGHELWKRTDLNVTGYGSAAIADLDNDGKSEIVVSNHDHSKLIAVRNDGSLMWNASTGTSSNWYEPTYGGITVADLNQDGKPEVIQGNRVFDNEGNLQWVGQGDIGGPDPRIGSVPIAADVDPDSPGMEVIAGRTLYGADGHIIWNRTDIACDGFNGVGDFGYPNPPQVVLVSCGTLYLLDRDGGTIWKTAIAGGGTGGSPTIADFGGEGKPQIGVAGAYNYAVYGGDGSIRWTANTNDTSSRVTGSSAFDFLEDGRVEILYGDQQKLRVYDGASGAVVWSIDNPSLTTFEYPVVADVDNDGHADIVAGANVGTPEGVRVFSAASGGWAPTRTVWNEHAYHVTNINDDGSVPRVEPNSWEHGNTYRLNAFLDHKALDGPDLTAGALALVDNGTGNLPSLNVRIGNGGQVITKPTTVVFYSGDPANGGTRLGSLAVAAIAPGQFLDLVLPNVTGLIAGDAIDVDVDPDNHVEECDKTNNVDHIPYAASNALAQLSVATDAPGYPANAPVHLTGTASNGGSVTADYALDLRIEDAEGNVVLDFGKQSLGSVVGGASALGTDYWNTADTLAGPYVLHGLLYGADDALLAQARAPFTITSVTASLAAHVATDRRTYAPNDHVLIASRVTNVSGNGMLSDLSLALAVKAPNGTTLFTASYPISQLLPGASRGFQSPQPLHAAPAGNYVVTQTVTDAAGTVLDTQHASYTVASTSVTAAGLSGQISATPEAVMVGRDVSLTASATNQGNAALTGLPLTISIIDPASQTVIKTFTQTTTLGEGASVPFDTRWISQGAVGTTYFAVLTATVGSGADAETVTLAQDAFTLVAQVAAQILATGGTPQAAIIGKDYAQALQATVLDTAGHPLPGIGVTFAAPTSGASVIFPMGHTAVTDANGHATVAVRANGVAGQFQVRATAPDVASAALFDLHNSLPVSVPVPINPWMLLWLAGVLGILGVGFIASGRDRSNRTMTAVPHPAPTPHHATHDGNAA